MADKASILREAQKFLAKGQLDKAIAEGEALVKSFPDSNTFNFLGDLYLKKGDKEKACGAYHRTAKTYRDEGFSLKALAIFKKILNINPADADALMALGQLNEEKNITTDAIKFYLAAADSFLKNKKADDALRVYMKILALAPQNIPLRSKIAEMLAKQGFTTQAAGEFRDIGEVFEEKGDLEQAKENFIKSLDVMPSSRKTVLSLSRIAEKAGDLEQAINYVKIGIERTGSHKELLLRKIHLLTKTGSMLEAREYLDKLLQGEDVDLDVRKTHADFVMKAEGREKAWEIYAPLIDDLIIAERRDEAGEILKNFKKAMPVETAGKYIALYKSAGDNEAAFREAMSLADFYKRKGMMQDALTALTEARVIQPENEEVSAKVEEIRALLQPEEAEKPEEPEMPPVSEMAEVGEAPAMPEEAVAREKPQDEAMTEVEVFLKYGLYDEAKNRLEALRVNEPNNINVHLKLKTLYLKTNEKERAVTECIVLAELFGRAGDTKSRKQHIREAYDLNPSDPRLEGKLAEIGVTQEEALAAAAQSGAATGIEACQSDIAEAEFYATQGFHHEAYDIYKKLLGMFPDNGDIKAKLDEAKRAMEEPSAEEALEGMETLSFDDLLAEAPPPGDEAAGPALESDVMEVFEEFKKGLEEQVSSEDTETHYNLGIAYKEMGLLDDAISTFQTAKKDPSYFVRASSMLGACYMEKGLYPLAADAYRSVLTKMPPGDETVWSVKYELAEALEKEGKLGDALGCYTEVYGWDSTFRQVAEKVDALKKEVAVEKPTPEAAPKPSKPKEPIKLDTKRKSRVSYI